MFPLLLEIGQKLVNWLPVYIRVHKGINAIIFKFVNNACPYYLNEVYEFVLKCRIESRSNFAKLRVPFRETNMVQKVLSYIDPLFGTIYADPWKKAQSWLLLNIILNSNFLDPYSLPIYLFKLLFGCPTANFGPLSRGQSH